MTPEQKDLLINDLCARLQYRVKVEAKGLLKTIADDYDNRNIINAHVLNGLNIGERFNTYSINGIEKIPLFNRGGVCNIKPYLFPLSSMTEEQEEELITITNGNFRYMWGKITNAIPRKNTSEWGISENAFINGIEVINVLYIWLLKNHFDINGLIPMGLANDATNLNIY